MGDPQFEELFDSCFDRCCTVARRIVGDARHAEDIAAEAFARAYAHWPSLCDQPGRVGWVLRVTVNLSIDAVRRRPAPRQAPAPARSLEDAAALRLALVAALKQLPARQRRAIALRYLADLSEQDVAAALGVSAGTVKTHIHRGMTRLRESLGASDEEEVHVVLDGT